MNSVMQALLASSPVIDLFSALPCPNNKFRSLSSSPVIDALTEFVREFSPMRGTTGIAYTPLCLYTMLKREPFPEIFSAEGMQQDAEEFLSVLLNGANDEMRNLMRLAKNKQENTPITEIFGGLLQSIVHRKYERTTVCVESFYILPLNIEVV